MSGGPPDLAVSTGVVRDVVRLAAAENTGIARVGRRGRWGRLFGRRAVSVHVDASRSVTVRIHVVARPGIALPATAESVRLAVATAIGRVLGLTAADVMVVVDGVGN